MSEIKYQAYFTKQNDTIFNDFNTIDFKPLTSKKISYKNGWYWFKIVLIDKNVNSQDLVFNIQEPSIDSITIYDSKKQIIARQKLNLHSFKLQQPTNKVFYINAHFKRQVHFPLQIFSYQHFPTALQFQNLSTGLYYGLAIMVFLFNFIFYVALKDETFLYYCLFLGSINISFTGFDGVFNLFVSENIVDVIVISFHFLIQVFGVLFATQFLGLQNFYPKLNRLGINLLLVPAIFYTLFFVSHSFVYLAIADLLGLLLLSFYWILGVLMIKKETFAKFFVIGYSMILFAGIFYLVPLNFGISSISVSFTQLKFGAFFEMLVLTFATIYRVKLLHDENKQFSSEIKKHVQQIIDLETQINEVKSEEEKGLFIEQKIQQIANEFSLTARESDLLLQIVSGLDNKQIAEKLFISVNTVKYHTRNIYEKLDVKKRGEIISKLLFDK